MQTPAPSFENLLQQQTGVNSYGEDVTGHQRQNYCGVFSGLNTSYGPLSQSDNGFPGMRGGDTIANHGFGGPQQLTADQLQMRTAQDQFGGNLHQANDKKDNQNSPVRKVKKYEGTADGQGRATSAKKKDKKSKHSSEHGPKHDATDSKPVTSQLPQNADEILPNISDNSFGDIPIANDTGRGSGFSKEFLASMQGFDPLTMSFNTVQQQQQHAQEPTLTASPTDLGDYMPALPSQNQNNYSLHGSHVGGGNMRTGITPHFNEFGFTDINNNGHYHDIAMPNLYNEDGFDKNNYGGMDMGMGTGADMVTPTNANFGMYSDNTNSSFSSSTGTATTLDSSQSDQATVPRASGMQYGVAGDEGPWMPRWGGDTDVSMGGDEDPLWMLNQENYA